MKKKKTIEVESTTKPRVHCLSISLS